MDAFCALILYIIRRPVPNASSAKAEIRTIHPSKVFGMVYPIEGFDLGV